MQSGECQVCHTRQQVRAWETFIGPSPVLLIRGHDAGDRACAGELQPPVEGSITAQFIEWQPLGSHTRIGS